ncbi:MAG: hypothetical protein COY38_04470 [Candidatus Aenigmarchaeota archaeon CG_4_10_14_0_8_um_filter_37_24]|nr:hypothetical protein [Candidatus Aenigmarchaeota archaeon]PIV69512.1 MAG: hypothetical protein COS07_00550 [Candidatus Aenigmarchaeota archaeon CG01_land_8_20_14_3_00_37_9]PIW41048.1 MAG: hypothetical protein COW21_03910 [Candidatus Aenigmarchaeota archaeon CG15_BIG_FIL_POST_REV_8_21_14_020_37_27]PIY34831.1 MAG: hypothetical protein COZ04_05640 [Candidatus Aenigmarchaeota archaeon CG_4_10_14_3_um_filter_37_21]PIZ34380.1 MAG: hypothetical protein COY38_04470 [Candidatus Aenigmarchaeota archae
MLPDQEIKKLILYKLFNRRCWGGKHTSFDNLKKGIKISELGKGGIKRINEMEKELIKEGLLIAKPTHYGLEVSLNPRMHEEIIEFIKKLEI